MSLRKGNRVELTVENMAFGGQGVARMDDFVIFVRGAVPGDKILARVIKKKRAYAEALIVELLDPSPDRIHPPCPYHGYCGGCQWQHVPYDRQLTYKKEHINEACTRIGAIQDAAIHDVIPSKEIFAYRNKMEFSFSDRRWYLPDDMPAPENYEAFALGLHVPG
ncbi:MAG: class I SAM-dependent RNA methyltransferase, partial [Deltaproteobacteria bacterium]|nr:class I SAM-dependent RNA methyltransferase [Deltaproteobacteria bacterium]